jgi:ArsR family transcriptional regulator
MSKSWLAQDLVQLSPAQSAACCSPVTSEALTLEQAERVAALLKAVADPVRLRLLSLVAAHVDSEACVCELNEAFDLSQPTISHHLKVLYVAGLLERSKRGTWVYYRNRANALADLSALFGGPAR